MSAVDRLRLIGEIWDNLTHTEQIELLESHCEYLDRRLADADTNPGTGRAWEEGRTRLRGEG